jgi:hypothetical protein
VASRTLAEPLAWQNASVLQDDVAEAVAALKQEDGEDLPVRLNRWRPLGTAWDR